MSESHTEVLVIGAGPTGLFAAAELARHGVRPRIIDSQAAPHTQTRATGVQPASLEVLQRAGVVDRFLEAGVPVKGVRILDREWREAFAFSAAPPESDYPHTCSIPQWRTEEILVEHLAGLGVEVERGVTAYEITPSDAGARVCCSGPGGGESIVHADYLIGAGGAHGPLRGALHEHLEGITYSRRYLVADVRAEGVHDERRLMTLAISPVGLVMLVELPAGRTLVVSDVPDSDGAAVTPTIGDVRASFAAHLADPFPISDLRWASIYHTHRRQAPLFSRGRCFLAGDAAHLCSPFGGEGMNSGFLDGVSLGWKLAAVLRRGGKQALLDAYHAERTEVARQVLASSDAVREFYYALVDMAVAGQPLEPPPPASERGSTSPAMLDVSFTSSPIVAGHGTPPAVGGPRPGMRFAARTRLGGCSHHLLLFGGAGERERAALAHRWSAVLEIVEGESVCPPQDAGVGPGGAVLVRPDGYIGFQAQVWDAGALERHLGQQFHARG